MKSFNLDRMCEKNAFIYIAEEGQLQLGSTNVKKVWKPLWTHMFYYRLSIWEVKTNLKTF